MCNILPIKPTTHYNESIAQRFNCTLRVGLWPESPCQLPCAPLPLYKKPDMIHLYNVALDTVQCIQ